MFSGITIFVTGAIALATIAIILLVMLRATRKRAERFRREYWKAGERATQESKRADAAESALSNSLTGQMDQANAERDRLIALAENWRLVAVKAEAQIAYYRKMSRDYLKRIENHGSQEPKRVQENHQVENEAKGIHLVKAKPRDGGLVAVADSEFIADADDGT